MGIEFAFYVTDHRLIALVIVLVFGIVCEAGFRAGRRDRNAPDSYRSLVGGIGAAMFGLPVFRLPL